MTTRDSASWNQRLRSLVMAAGLVASVGVGSAFGAGPVDGATGGNGGQVGGGGGVGIDAPRVMLVPKGTGRYAYRVHSPNAATSVADRFESVMLTNDDDAAAPGFELYNRLVVRAASTADAVAAVERFGAGIDSTMTTENLAGLTGATVFETRTVAEAVALAQRLQGQVGVDHVELDEKTPMVARGAPYPDTLAAMQWHLSNPMMPIADHNISDLYERGYTGAGITVGVLETGGTPFHINHPEISPNVALNISMILDTLDPTPSHGTSVAGLIASKVNGVGMAGVMPNARLVALSNGPSIRETQAHQWKNGIIHLKNNSWGPNPYLPVVQVIELTVSPSIAIPVEWNAGDLFPSSNPGLAVAGGIANGRQGKGTAFVWAAGNTSTSLVVADLGSGTSIILPTGDVTFGALGTYNVYTDTGGLFIPATFGAWSSYDPYVNTHGVFGIGAVTETNEWADYSTMGPGIFASTYSGPGFLNTGDGIYTLDAITDFGMYDPNSLGMGFTDSFGGTSAASPIATGIIGLLMSIRPDLPTRDLMHIIERTAIRLDFDPSNPYWQAGGDSFWQTNFAWTVNGRQVAHSDQFGFGLIDPVAAADLAEVWPGLPPQLILERFRSEEVNDEMPLTIPDATLEEVGEMHDAATLAEEGFTTTTFCVPYDIIVEDIELTINATGNSPGDLYIEVESPYGTISPMHLPHIDNREGTIDGQAAAFIDYRLKSFKNWGEPAAGEWTIRFLDFRPNADPMEGTDDGMGLIEDYQTDYPTYFNIPTLPGNPQGSEISIIDYTFRIYGYDVGRENPNACENRLNSFCPHDIDGDGLVTADDLMLFIELWRNQEPVGDWDGSGVWDFNDVFLYFITWQPGPCDFGQDDNDTNGTGPTRPGDGGVEVIPI